jgi:hypothetical protein
MSDDTADFAAEPSPAGSEPRARLIEDHPSTQFCGSKLRGCERCGVSNYFRQRRLHVLELRERMVDLSSNHNCSQRSNPLTKRSLVVRFVGAQFEHEHD